MKAGSNNQVHLWSRCEIRIGVTVTSRWCSKSHKRRARSSWVVLRWRIELISSIVFFVVKPYWRTLASILLSPGGVRCEDWCSRQHDRLDARHTCNCLEYPGQTWDASLDLVVAVCKARRPHCSRGMLEARGDKQGISRTRRQLENNFSRWIHLLSPRTRADLTRKDVVVWKLLLSSGVNLQRSWTAGWEYTLYCAARCKEDKESSARNSLRRRVPQTHNAVLGDS